MSKKNSDLALTDLNRIRLFNQQISKSKFKKPDEVLNWLGAIQGQDYYGAKWSVALRLPGANDSLIEKAIAEKEIIRTWAMRGTLHFVAANDIRWMLALVSSKLILGNTSRDRQLGLDRKKYERSFSILKKALLGGKQLIRDELIDILKTAGIKVNGMQLSHILQRAGLQQIICFGVRRGKQFTYTLLDEWIPESKKFGRDEALAELALRYFKSRGPATLQDFAWWSGLNVSVAGKNLEMVKTKLVPVTFNNRDYWMTETGKIPDNKKVFLLPGFDEYIIAYKDRSTLIESEMFKKINAGGGMLTPTVIIDGKVAGTWKREVKKDMININVKIFQSFNKNVKKLIAEAAEHYGKFNDMSVEILF